MHLPSLNFQKLHSLQTHRMRRGCKSEGPPVGLSTERLPQHLEIQTVCLKRAGSRHLPSVFTIRDRTEDSERKHWPKKTSCMFPDLPPIPLSSRTTFVLIFSSKKQNKKPQTSNNNKTFPSTQKGRNPNPV